jgi:hypothetical protein
VVAAAAADARAGPEDLWFDEVLGGATGGMPRWYSAPVTFEREFADSETTGDWCCWPVIGNADVVGE